DAGLDDRAARVDSRGLGRESGGQIADERGAARCPHPREGVREGAHDSPVTRPNHLAAVLTSLSPRPDKLTRTMPSGPSSAPRRSAPAIACALSNAGMIPSVRHSN